MRMKSAVIAAAAGVLAAATMTSAASAGTGRSGCSWTIVPAPAAPGGNALYSEPVPGMSDAAFAPEAGLTGVSALSSGDAWFTGYSAGTASPWVLRWDGHAASAATQVPQGIAGGFGRGSASSFDSGTDGWLLGQVGTLQADAQVAEHWNGSQWTMTPLAVSPDPVSEYPILNDVVALSPDDAWAVGNFQQGASVIPGAVVEHWDGSTWNVVPNPASSQQLTLLTRVTAASPDDIWAVGYQVSPNGGHYAPFVEHYGGTGWSIFPAPPVSSGNSGLLFSVSADGNGDVWAGGLQGPGPLNGDAPLIEHWNGGAWTAQQLPAVPGSVGLQFAEINGIYAASPSDVWAPVLAVTSGNLGAPADFLHWDGSTWTLVPAPGPKEYGLNYFWNAISGTGPDNVWAAGTLDNAVYGTDTPQIARLSCGS